MTGFFVDNPCEWNTWQCAICTSDSQRALCASHSISTAAYLWTCLHVATQLTTWITLPQLPQPLGWLMTGRTAMLMLPKKLTCHPHSVGRLHAQQPRAYPTFHLTQASLAIFARLLMHHHAYTTSIRQIIWQVGWYDSCYIVSNTLPVAVRPERNTQLVLDVGGAAAQQRISCEEDYRIKRYFFVCLCSLAHFLHLKYHTDSQRAAALPERLPARWQIDDRYLKSCMYPPPEIWQNPVRQKLRLELSKRPYRAVYLHFWIRRMEISDWSKHGGFIAKQPIWKSSPSI